MWLSGVVDLSAVDGCFLAHDARAVAEASDAPVSSALTANATVTTRPEAVRVRVGVRVRKAQLWCQ